LIDDSVPHGRQYNAKGNNLRALDDAAIETILAHYATDDKTPTSAVLLGWMGGAMARVDAQATAFGERTAPLFFEIATSCPRGNAELFARNRQWARDLAEALAPASAGSVYVNQLGNEGQERVRIAYGAAKYDRLAALKAKYDPDNVFRLNQNILPAR
jgi:FAD/FMN-containing dehydrogenase